VLPPLSPGKTARWLQLQDKTRSWERRRRTQLVALVGGYLPATWRASSVASEAWKRPTAESAACCRRQLPPGKHSHPHPPHIPACYLTSYAITQCSPHIYACCMHSSTSTSAADSPSTTHKHAHMPLCVLTSLSHTFKLQSHIPLFASFMCVHVCVRVYVYVTCLSPLSGGTPGNPKQWRRHDDSHRCRQAWPPWTRFVVARHPNPNRLPLPLSPRPGFLDTQIGSPTLPITHFISPYRPHS